MLKKLDEIDKKCERTQWSMLLKLLIVDNIKNLYITPRCMTVAIWNSVHKYTSELIDLLTANPRYRLHLEGLCKLELNKEEKAKLREKEEAEETTGSAFTPISHGLAEAEDMLKLQQGQVEEVDDDHVDGLSDEFYWLRGSLYAICRLLSDDLVAGFKKSDEKTAEYDERLKAQDQLVELCQKCLHYVSTVTGHRMDALSFRHLIVQLTYQSYDKEFDQLASKNSLYVPFTIPQTTLTLQHVVAIFKELKEFDPELFGAANEAEIQLFQGRKQKIEVETVLFCTHYLALHHKYELARDIFTSSGYGKDSTFSTRKVLIQVLYNRTVARLAIAAFTHEDWRQSMDLLKSLYMTGKLKELLAQGVKSDLKWKHNKTQDEIQQMQKETQRMVPAHTFINQDLLESVHYISSLFFEMKAILSPKDTSVVNRSFRRQWDFRQKREFLAPPENTRDRIMEAGAQMMKGNWRECIHQLKQLKCWEHFEYADVIKDRVMKRAKKECLRCYLISSAKHFSDVHLDVLADKFDMPVEVVVKFCSQFIVNQDIRASIDSIGRYLVIHEPLPTLFETSASNFHNKLSQFLSAIHEHADMIGIKDGSRKNYQRSNREGNQRSGGSWR